MTRLIVLMIVPLITIVAGDNKDSELKLAQTQDCRLLADGIYSDPSDCHRYFHCSGSKTFYFRCYDGFVFDPCDLRCKIRDVCIPAEFCNKNLQNNLTLNMYRQTPSSTVDTSKIVNEVIKLNELQNDAEIRDGGHKVENQNNGRNFVQGSGDPSLHGTGPYYPPSPPPVPSDRRYNEVQQETSKDYYELPTTTEELRLAVVRNFNGIEQSGTNIVLPNITEYKHSRSSMGEHLSKTSSIGSSTTIANEWTERSHAYPVMMATGASTTGAQESTSSATKSDRSITMKSDQSISNRTHSTNEPREFAADAKENKKGPSELEEEKLSARRLASQGTTTTSATTTTAATPNTSLTSSTHFPTSSGTTEATMTYIVKVVFSRRGRPDSQKGGETESVEEGSTSFTPATTTSAHTTTTESSTTADVETSRFEANDHTNSARIKTIDPVVIKKSNDKNVTSNTSFAPINNSLAVGLQNQGDPPNSVRFNFTSNPTESLDQFKNFTVTSGTSTTKSNVTFATESARTTTENLSTTDFFDLTESNNSTSTSESWLTKSHQKTTSHQTNQSFANLTVDNHTTDSPTSKTTTSSTVTVTISSAARLVNNSVEEGKSVMSNITLSCNPTISSALCEKSDNQTREALARHCQQLTCNNGGMFISLSNGHCGCACPNGFKGENCLDLVDRSMCHCSNGGRCVEIGNDTFACRCPLGYLGNKCQYAIDDLQPKISNLLDSPPPGPKLAGKGSVDLNKYLLCMVNHCSNGGICLKEIETGSSQCFCSHNFAGQYCEKKCINC